MGCCIAAALIASQGLTLSERVRKFLRHRIGLGYFRLPWTTVALVIGAEFVLLAALFQFEFGSAQVHAAHLFSLVKSLNFLGGSSAEFAICRGVAALD